MDGPRVLMLAMFVLVLVLVLVVLVCCWCWYAGGLGVDDGVGGGVVLVLCWY